MQQRGKKSEDNNEAYSRNQEDVLVDSQFKRMFKFYKRTDDLGQMLDIKKFPSSSDVCFKPFVTKFDPPSAVLSCLGLKPINQWRVATIKKRMGLHIFSDIFEPSKHLEWVNRSVNVYAEPPSKTNIGLHSPDVSHVFPRCCKKLRWATMGLHYDWSEKTYPTHGDPIPEELSVLANLISRSLDIGEMEADAVIVNYYPLNSTLSGHVDRSERSLEKPLISISFAQSAIYLIGGQSPDDPVDALLLRSGDMLVMHGSQRLVYHGVPRILITHTFDETAGISADVVDYANMNRVNITIRQVNDKS